MSLDSKIIEAIETAVDECGQPHALAKRLIAWLQAVADESEDINDIAATDRHLEIIYEAVSLGGGAPEEAPADYDGNDDEEDD